MSYPKTQRYVPGQGSSLETSALTMRPHRLEKFAKVSVGLTVGVKRAKNVAVRRKNWKNVTDSGKNVNRKKKI